MVEIKTTEELQKVVSENETVLVDFWADWCGPCKMLAPQLEELSQRQPNVIIAKVNVDEAQELAAEHQIMSIPTMLLFKNGNIVDKRVGFQPVDALEDFVK